jgi:thiol-disulfide isomerase/thioredoxin
LLAIFKVSIVVEFILYSRSYCHLCEDMLHALQALKTDYAFHVTVEDVDASPVLLEQYDELVPVLVGKQADNTIRLCHYFLDEERVRAFLQGDFIETKPV